MRYLARFTNGTWVLFDTWSYANLETYDRQVEAESAAAWANGGDAIKRAAAR